MPGDKSMTFEQRFVFVCPMFNMADTLPQLLYSICGQSYSNWRLILIDDVSSKEQAIREREIIDSFLTLAQPGWQGLPEHERKIVTVWNETKRWEVANVLHGISMCNDEDIVCRIDADDWLTEIDALAMIDSAYMQSQCDALWTAHRWAYSDKNISGPMSPGSDPYRHPWVSSHLKTFKKRLLNGVNDENFRNENGDYVKRAGDQAIYLPCLHNAKRYVFLPRVMYHYTINDVPETYQTNDARFQRDEALFLRARGYVK